MIIIEKNDLRLRLSIYWILIAIILFIPCFQTYGTDGWPSDDEFEIYGFKVRIYFDPAPNPEPGTISSDTESIKGIISINGEFTGYDFQILIYEYGTIYKDDKIFSNEDIGQRFIILNSSIKSYTEEILIETPSTSGQFTVYMVIYFGWREEMTPDFTGNKTIILDAEYQKLGYDLANIIIPGVIFLSCICLIFISVFGYKKLHKRKDIDINEINELLERINIINKQYFTRAGNFKDLDRSKIRILTLPGQLGLLENRKQEIKRKLEKLEPRQDELDKITKRLEEARNPILNNDLFKLISSHFIHASRKRENYPPIDKVEDRVLELRNSLRDGLWDEFQDLEKVKLAWMICETYMQELNDESRLLVTDIDVEKEAKTLTNHVKRYIQIKNDLRWPPDRDLILKTIEELKAELETNSRLIEKLKKSDKKSLKKYKKKCENLKKEAEALLKWLEATETEIDDPDLLNRNSIRLKKLIDLLDNERNLFS